jgi:preprotein translocase subunit SecF
MLVYIAFRFEWIYGFAAVIAVFHDTIITIGLFSLFNKEISLTVVAALLTLVGYSMNDTIVVFDRIRENLKLLRREPLESVINKSVNQTLSRTVLTSGLTFLTAISLFLFGGQVLNGFSFALVVGILVGTYSSVFVASPILVFWQDYREGRKKKGRLAPVPVTPVGREKVGSGAGRSPKAGTQRT